MMRYQKGDRRVENKFAEVKRVKDRKFIGVIETKSTSHRVTFTCDYRRQAINEFEKVANRMKGKLNHLTVHALNLTGSRWSLILPVAINTFNLIVMRTAMAAVPDSLPESAMMDGAGHLRILVSIMVPLTKATLAVITLYYAVYHWNSWFNAMIFLHKKYQYPLLYRHNVIRIDASNLHV